MKLHLASAAVAALLASLPACAATITYGDTPAASCAKAALAEGPGISISEPAHRGALKECDAALKDKLLLNDRTATLVNRGIVNAAMGRTDAAIADYDAALARAPEMANAYLNRGTAQLRAGHFEAAKADLDHALMLKTDQAAIAYFSRGMANEKLGDLAAAYHDYKQAQTLAPDFAPAHLELARFQVKNTQFANR